MRCYLKCQIFSNWEEEYEWTRRLHEGQVLQLGQRDLPFNYPSCVDEVQVVCKVDMVKKVVLVKRVGNSPTKDHLFKEIGLGETAEIPEDEGFSLGGGHERIYVTFEKDDNDSETEEEEEESKQEDVHEGEIYYNGCWYDEDSHSLEREKMRNGD